MKGLKRSLGDSESNVESDENGDSQESNDEAGGSSHTKAIVDHRESSRADFTSLDPQAVGTKVKRARLQ